MMVPARSVVELFTDDHFIEGYGDAFALELHRVDHLLGKTREAAWAYLRGLRLGIDVRRLGRGPQPLMHRGLPNMALVDLAVAGADRRARVVA